MPVDEAVAELTAPAAGEATFGSRGHGRLADGVGRRLNITGTLMVAAAVAIPGLALVAGMAPLLRSLRGSGTKAAAEQKPPPANFGGLTTKDAPPPPPSPRAALPPPSAVPDNEIPQYVGRFVRHRYEAGKLRGRSLAREVGDLVTKLEAAGRIASRDGADLNRPPPNDEWFPDEALRARWMEEDLGVFAIEQVRSGRQSVGLGESLADEMHRLQQMEERARAAEEKFHAALEKRRLEESARAEADARRAAEPRRRVTEPGPRTTTRGTVRRPTGGTSRPPPRPSRPAPAPRPGGLD